MIIQYDAILKETEFAFLVKFDNDEIWIPKSQIKNGFFESLDEGGGELSVAIWFEKDKGLEQYEV
jgi:hypothetical protein